MEILYDYQSDALTNTDERYGSSYCKPIRLEIYIDAKAEDYAEAECISAMDMTNPKKPIEIDYLKLGPEFQAEVERILEEKANELGYEAYHQYMQGECDRVYDEWKDRQVDEELNP